MALSEQIFTESFYNSQTEFNENPRVGLVAVTTSQTDRYVIVHIRHSSFTSYETPKNSVRTEQSNTYSLHYMNQMGMAIKGSDPCLF